MTPDFPGRDIAESELLSEGFLPFLLDVRSLLFEYATGSGCEWTTLGEVPKGPGLYAFTVEGDGQLRVAYVGLTEELWMVTKGRLPSGAARPGQRYGRPRYAGATRQRINGLIAQQLQQGRVVRHWVRSLTDPPTDRAALRRRLLQAEQELISRWGLRQVGWNRG